MTALQWIIKEAKILRKKSPKMEWKKAVAQASAIYASKHKGKSPVGKKKVAKKKIAKKVGYSKVRLNQEKGITKVLKSTPRTMFPYTAEEKIIKAGKKYYDVKAKGLSGVKRKIAKKKKPSEQSILNKIHKVKHDVQRLDEAQHKHMIGALSTHLIHELKEAHIKLINWQKILLRLQFEKKKYPDSARIINVDIKRVKDAIKEQKTHIAQLKKHIK